MIKIGTVEMEKFLKGHLGVQRILKGKEIMYDRGKGYNIIDALSQDNQNNGSDNEPNGGE